MASVNEIGGNIQKCIGHLKVIASVGDQESMDNLMRFYKHKLLSKEDLTQTLRAYQASSSETKSKDRENATRILEEARKKGEDPP